MSEMKPLLVGISGIAGAGKNTFAEISEMYLKNVVGNGIRVGNAAFADALKEGVSNLFRFPPEWTQTEDGKRKNVHWAGNKTVREILQIVGTDIARAIDQNIWINLLDRKIKEEMSNHDVIFITDTRFENEAQYILANGGILVYIDASKRIDRINSHSSENLSWTKKYIDGNMMYYVDNNGTLDVLHSIALEYVYFLSEKIRRRYEG